MELQKMIEEALAFFDSPDSESLDLDGLEDALRETQKFLNTRSIQVCSLNKIIETDSEAEDSNDISAGSRDTQGMNASMPDETETSDNAPLNGKDNESGELSKVTEERDCLRDHIVRQIQGDMRVMNYSESEISEVETITDPGALLTMEKKVRAEFDGRFQTLPLVSDEADRKVMNVGVYRIA